jgi:hypothetical protein
MHYGMVHSIGGFWYYLLHVLPPQDEKRSNTRPLRKVQTSAALHQGAFESSAASDADNHDSGTMADQLAGAVHRADPASMALRALRVASPGV